MDPQSENTPEEKKSQGSRIGGFAKRRLLSFAGRKLATQAALAVGRTAVAGTVSFFTSNPVGWAVGGVILFLSVFTFLIVGFTNPPSEEAPTPTVTPPPNSTVSWLHAEGNRLINESGQTVGLRGATIVRWVWSRSNPNLDHAVADNFTKPKSDGGWGANAFTLWVDNDRISDGTYWPYADEMVNIAVRNNAYVIFAWHADGDEDHPSHINDRGIASMGQVAARFKDIPNVLYITQAEPGNGKPDGQTISWNQLKPYQEATIDAIRAESPRALVGYSGTNWSQSFEALLADPIQRPNLFVQPHIYNHSEFGNLTQLLNDRKIPELASRIPIVIGEFGDKEWPSELIQYADSGSMGWQAWNLSNMGNPVMLKSMDISNTNAFGETIKNAL